MVYRFVKERLQRGPGELRAQRQPLAAEIATTLDPAGAPSPLHSTVDTRSNGLDAALADFRRRYPTYDSTAKLDALRATEYARLDREQHVYLDYTGGGLYAES